MRKLLVSGIAVFCAVVFTVCSIYAAEDADKDFNELRMELQRKGMAANEIKEAEKPAKDMLKRGASREELRETLLNLSRNGVRGKDLKKTVDSMDDLMKSGKSPKEAGNIVSQAVHQAQAEGLRGTALADKVHQAIKQMQSEKKKLKQMKEEQRERKRSSEEMQRHDMKGMGGGMGHNQGRRHGGG